MEEGSLHETAMEENVKGNSAMDEKVEEEDKISGVCLHVLLYTPLNI